VRGAVSFDIPEGDADMATVRALNWAYREVLLALPEEDRVIVNAVYTPEKYTAMLEAAETANRPPLGQMRLVRLNGTPVGCGTVQTLPGGEAEIKRVYIVPEAQGRGLGRRLMEVLIEDCRALGFARILMDTGIVLTGAQALYDSMGFRRRGPYQDLPPEAEGRIVFYEMDL